MYLKISKSDAKEGKIIRNFYWSFFFNIEIRLRISISSIFHPTKQIKVHRLIFSLLKDAIPLTSLKIIIRLLGKVCSPASYSLPSILLHFTDSCTHLTTLFPCPATSIHKLISLINSFFPSLIWIIFILQVNW